MTYHGSLLSGELRRGSTELDTRTGGVEGATLHAIPQPRRPETVKPNELMLKHAYAWSALLLWCMPVLHRRRSHKEVGSHR